MPEVPWTQREADGWVVVTASGELDIADAGAFGETLVAALADGHDLAVDARGLEFIDSSGLGALLTALRRSEETGRRFVVVPSPAVSRVMSLTGTAEAFELRETLEPSLERPEA